MKTPPPDLATRLLAASGELLSPGGMPPFGDLAERLDVSRATLYYYFAGQDDLLGFLLRAHVDAGAAVMAAADPGAGPVAERLRAVLGAAIGYLGEHPGMCTGLLAAAGAGPGMDEVLALNDARIAGTVRELLAAGAATGEFDVADRRDSANAMLGAVVMAVVARAAEGRDTMAPEFRSGLVDQLVRGLAAT
ncbi:MAG TPA: TetR/AcrR family transcriptional regulator [Egicoccus sp.]|nr:TetR/AcrR family transcriptional regulator [Egicoccus sp.]HSK22971.1 TetR/AcrR family transcriptional regulator [Egicoccus sp.]